MAKDVARQDARAEAREQRKAARRAAQEEFKATNIRLREETQRRMDESRPTPTQEENDEAKLRIESGEGVMDMELEPDGSEPEEERMVTPASVGASYETRDVAVRRGPGRPRKTEGGGESA